MITNRIREAVSIKENMLQDPELQELIMKAAQTCIDAFRQGGKVLLCGNGGSAADAQHIAAELSGRFYYDRPPLDAEALHVNTSYLTAVANDYSYADIFSRIIQGRGKSGDVLIAFSTSGNSPNVLKAIETAANQKMSTIGFTGTDGGKMRSSCDILIRVPSEDTARIQENHIFIGHLICEIIEKELFPK